VNRLSIPEDDVYRELHRGWETSHSLGSPIHALRRSLVLRLAPPAKENSRCLDIGCGTGEYIEPLIDMGYRVDAVDISHYAIDRAQKNLPKEKRSFFKGIVAPLERFTPDKKFDLILCSEVLEHLEDPLLVLKKVAQWVSDGGSLLITVPADPALWSEEDVFAHHVRRFTEAQFKALLAEAKLQPEVFWCYGYPTLRLLLLLKQRLLKKKAIGRIQEMGQKRSTQWILRWVNTIVRGYAFLTDRYFLYHPKGIGFIALCRPQSQG